MGEAKQRRNNKYKFTGTVITKEQYGQMFRNLMAGMPDPEDMQHCILITQAIAECIKTSGDATTAKLCLSCDTAFTGDPNTPDAFAIVHLLNNPDKAVVTCICKACWAKHSETYLVTYFAERCISGASDITMMSNPAFGQ